MVDREGPPLMRRPSADAVAGNGPYGPAPTQSRQTMAGRALPDIGLAWQRRVPRLCRRWPGSHGANPWEPWEV